MFDSEISKSYKNMWKYRKLQSKMDMLRKLISVGVVLQLIANIGESFYMLPNDEQQMLTLYSFYDLVEECRKRFTLDIKVFFMNHVLDPIIKT